MNDDIFIGSSNGEVIHFSSLDQKGQILQDIICVDPILTILISKQHLITGSADGVLRFYTHDSFEFSREIVLNSCQKMWKMRLSSSEQPPEGHEQEVHTSVDASQSFDMFNNITGHDVRSLVLSGDFTKIISGTSDGAIFQTDLHSSDESIAEGQDINSELDDGTKLLYDSHVGIVTGIVHLRGTNLLVSCGEDGTLRVFNFQSCQLVHKVVFNCSFTTLSYLPSLTTDNLFYIILGTQIGYIHIMEVDVQLGENGEEDGIRCELIFHERIRKSTILEIKRNDWDPSMIGISFSDDHIAFVHLDHVKRRRLDQSTNAIYQNEEIDDSDGYSEEIRVLSDGILTVIGYVRSPLPVINTFEWKNKDQLFVSIGDEGAVVEMNAPRNDSKRIGSNKKPADFDGSMGHLRFYFDMEDLAYDAYKLDFPAYGIAFPKEFPDNFYTLSKDKRVKYFKIVAASENDIDDYHVQERAKPGVGLSNVRTINFPDDVNSHFKIGNCIQVSEDGKLLATGARDGLVWLRNTSVRLVEQSRERMECDVRALHDPTLGGVSRICFTYDNEFLCSAGYDGSIFVYRVSSAAYETLNSSMFMNDKCFTFGRMPIQQSILSKDRLKQRDSDFLDDGQITEELEDPSFYERCKMKRDNVNNILVEAYRAEMNSEIEQLRAQFAEIEKENMEAPENERLDASELIIDQEYEKNENEKINERVLEYRKQIEYNNLGKEILLQRIKEEFWDPMDKRSVIVRSFNYKETDPVDKTRAANSDHHGGFSVANYVMKKPDPKQQAIVDKIRFMRRIEEIDMQHRRPYFCTFGLEEGIEEDNAPMNSHDGKQTLPVRQFQSLSNSENATSKRLDTADSCRTSASNLSSTSSIVKYVPTNIEDIITDNERLMFSPFDLYTRQRKVNQIHLIKACIVEMKSDFNKEFDEVHQLKKQTVQKILQTNEKIVDILEELDIIDQVREIQTQHENMEQEGGGGSTEKQQILLQLKPPQERPIRRELHVYNPKVHREENLDDYLLTLKPEEITFERWISPEDREKMEKENRAEEERIRQEQGSDAAERALFMMMDNTLEQQAQALEYSPITLKQRVEEEKKKQMQLEARLKNNKQDIVVSCERFDSRLKQLLDKRIATDQAINELELQAIKLSQSIHEEEDRVSRLNKMGRILEEMKEKNNITTGIIQELEQRLETVTMEKMQLMKEEETMTNMFRVKFVLRDVPQQQQEAIMDRLFRLYRTKSRFKEPSKQDVHIMAQKSHDPFAEYDARSKLIQLDEEQQLALSLPVDNNTGQSLVSQHTWEMFLQEKRNKFNLEKRLHQIIEKENKLSDKIERLREQLTQDQSEFNKRSNEHETYIEYMLNQTYNLDKLFLFLQGQVEVEQQAVVTDYTDAILITQDVIRQQNKEILKVFMFLCFGSRHSRICVRSMLTSLYSLHQSKWMIDWPEKD